MALSKTLLACSYVCLRFISLPAEMRRTSVQIHPVWHRPKHIWGYSLWGEIGGPHSNSYAGSTIKMAPRSLCSALIPLYSNPKPEGSSGPRSAPPGHALTCLTVVPLPHHQHQLTWSDCLEMGILLHLPAENLKNISLLESSTIYKQQFTRKLYYLLTYNRLPVVTACNIPLLLKRERTPQNAGTPPFFTIP